MKIVIALVGSFLSLAVLAQKTSKDTVKIPTVSIHSLKEISTHSQSIDSTALQNPLQKDLGEVLARRAHLFVKSYGLGSQSTVSLRGSGSSHTQVFWNDISLNSSMNGVSDLALYPTVFLDETKVNYGNSSLQMGSGGLGGAIQLNNNVSFGRKKLLLMQQDIGSFGYRNSSLKYEFGGKKLKSISRVFYRKANNNFEYEDLGEEGFPLKEVENASLEQKSFMQSLYYQLKQNQLLEMHLWYYDSDRNLPPLISLNNIEERQADESYRGMLAFKRYGDAIYFSLKTALLKDKIIYENNRLLNGTQSETFSSKTLAELKKVWNKVEVETRLNLDVEQAQHPSFVSTINRERLSVFGSIEYFSHPKLKINLSARQEWIFNEDDFFLPLLALQYSVNSNWTFFTQASKNLKYPSLNDLYWEFGGNSALKAEENQSYEWGLNYNKAIHQSKYLIESKAAAFYSQIDNYIQWQPTALGYWQAINLRDVEIRGVEASASIKDEKGKWKKSLFANYTYTQSLNRKRSHAFDESINKQLIYIPENQANFQLDVMHKGYQLSYQWQFVSARFTTTDNTEWQPDYQLSNLSISKQLKWDKSSCKLSFGVLNVFDLEYQAIQWRPMPNRNYQLSMQFQLL